MTKLNRIWKSSIRLSTKLKLYKSLVVSIVLYGCETWTLTAALEKKIQAFENKCLRKLLQISWTEHKTNNYVWSKIEGLAGPQEPLLSTVKRRKLKWFGHNTRRCSLSKTIMQGTVQGQRTRGRPRKNWHGNIREWTGLQNHQLLRAAADRQQWRRVVLSATPRSPLLKRIVFCFNSKRCNARLRSAMMV